MLIPILLLLLLSFFFLLPVNYFAANVLAGKITVVKGKVMLSLTVIILLMLFHTGFPVYGQEYMIGEGDLLRITVYDHPDLSVRTRVSGDGKIRFPLVGEVMINGLTATEIEGKIAGLLQDGYIKKPHVSVFIEEYKSKKVTVLGEFVKPGLVELRGNSTLLEVISNTGGITPYAGDTLYIQRKIIKGGSNKDEEVTVVVDLKRLLEEGDVSANVTVQDGDSIYVPRAAFVYITGEVKNPGQYKITKELTVLKAITLAGGFTPKARESKTKIIRKTDEGEITINTKMDDLVMPGDVITVPESLF